MYNNYNFTVNLLFVIYLIFNLGKEKSVKTPTYNLVTPEYTQFKVTYEFMKVPKLNGAC